MSRFSIPTTKQMYEAEQRRQRTQTVIGVLIALGLAVALVVLTVKLGAQQTTPPTKQEPTTAAPKSPSPDPLKLDAAAHAEVTKLQQSFAVIAEELATAQRQVDVLTSLRDKKLQQYREFIVRETAKRGLNAAEYLVDVEGGKLVSVAPTPPPKKGDSK